MIADQVSHDESLGIFVARGHVEILREGKIVKADVVTYNERTKRITAAGNVSLLEPDGDTQFASYADVTDDVKEGILYDFRMLMKDNSRLAANRAYRVDQDTKEILRKGVYTPCAQCVEDPSRAPLWQIKAYHGHPRQGGRRPSPITMPGWRCSASRCSTRRGSGIRISTSTARAAC